MRFVILLLFISTNVFAEDWFLISSNKENTTWEVKAGSFQKTTTTAKEPVFALVFRVKSGTQISFEKNYVRTQECESGMGKLVTTDLDGKVKYGTDFVFSGGSVASTIAEFICTVGGYKPGGSQL